MPDNQGTNTDTLEIYKHCLSCSCILLEAKHCSFRISRKRTNFQVDSASFVSSSSVITSHFYCMLAQISVVVKPYVNCSQVPT